MHRKTWVYFSGFQTVHSRSLSMNFQLAIKCSHYLGGAYKSCWFACAQGILAACVQNVSCVRRGLPLQNYSSSNVGRENFGRMGSNAGRSWLQRRESDVKLAFDRLRPRCCIPQMIKEVSSVTNWLSWISACFPRMTRTSWLKIIQCRHYGY